MVVSFFVLKGREVQQRHLKDKRKNRVRSSSIVFFDYSWFYDFKFFLICVMSLVVHVISCFVCASTSTFL